MVKIEKKYIIIAIVLLVACGIGWNVWSNGNVSDNGITANTVREQYKSVGDQQQRAGQAITASQSTVTEIQRSNNSIRSTNSEIKSTIDTGIQLNKSSADCINSSKQILRDVRKSGAIKD